MSGRLSRRTLGLAAVAAAVVGLSGCGLGGGTSNSARGGGDQLTGSMTGEITFSTLQLKPIFNDYINGVISKFQSAHPGAKVKWVDLPFQGAQDKITTDAQAGTLPDVINLNPQFAYQLEKKGQFIDLAKAAGDVKSQYVPGAWEAFQVPGQDGAFGLPWYLTSEVTMYNKDLFQQAGLDPAKPPTTYAELTADAKKIAAAGKGFYALHPALENHFMTDLARQGVPLMDPSGEHFAFNTPKAVAWTQTLVDLYKAKAMPPDSITQSHSKEIEAYQAGQIAMFPSGPNFLKIVKQNAPKVAQATGVGPQIVSTGGAPNMAVMGLLIPKSSKNQKLALEFAKYMTNAENQLAFSKIVTILPSQLSALKDPYFTDTSDGTVESQARKISAEQLPKAKQLLPVQYDAKITKIVVGKIQLAMQGQLSAKDALDQAVTEANKALAGS